MAEFTTGGDHPGGTDGYRNPFADSPANPPAAPPPARRDRVALARGAGLLAAGLLVGALAATALEGGSPAASASPAPAVVTAPGSAITPPDGATGQGLGQGLGQGSVGGQGPTGTTTGAQRIAGTVSAVTGSSVTVQGTDGTTRTYSVDSSTLIAKDGQQAALSDLQAGDTVLVRVTSGGVATRILVGSADQLQGGPPAGSAGQAPDGTQGGTGTTQGATGSTT